VGLANGHRLGAAVLPLASHTTEKVQWQDDPVFKVGGKMYAVAALEPGDHWLAFKCSAEEFASLVERTCTDARDDAILHVRLVIGVRESIEKYLRLVSELRP
jgi:hypothetical protein